MILFDAATARDLCDALRLLEGRLLGAGRQLSVGALEIREAAEVSLGVSGGQLPDGSDEAVDDRAVLRLLTYGEVADRLHVSVSMVKRLVRSGDLATVAIGSNARVRPADLDEYIAAQRRTTGEPLTQMGEV